MTKKIGIAGLGAIGGAVARALTTGDGICDMTLEAVSDVRPDAPTFGAPNVTFEDLAARCDLVVECLPPDAVPSLTKAVLPKNREMILISASALLLHPEIMDHLRVSKGRILVPSGALAGIDGVRAMAQIGIKKARIATTKKPIGFTGAPFIMNNNIDLSRIDKKRLLFSGNALEAAKGFPANINVAVTLSLAGIGPEKTAVEIWADPLAKGNIHEIEVQSTYSTITARVENQPDPANPKSSMLAAQSIVALLRGMTEPLVVRG
ncbi:MAG: aspartate dehydrogenase domain-containing protein [Alphaproteobacteria bacterium]